MQNTAAFLKKTIFPLLMGPLGSMSATLVSYCMGQIV